MRIARLGVAVHTARHWAEGGRGALELAHEVVRLCELPSTLRFAYADADPLWDKLQASWPRAPTAPADVRAAGRARADPAPAGGGYGHCRCAWPRRSTALPPTPRCAARPAAMCWTCARCGWPPAPNSSSWSAATVMTMPGLPKVPAAERIDIDEQGRIVGLS
jgi:formate--tetrahydrofolate ligase